MINIQHGIWRLSRLVHVPKVNLMSSSMPSIHHKSSNSNMVHSKTSSKGKCEESNFQLQSSDMYLFLSRWGSERGRVTFICGWAWSMVFSVSSRMATTSSATSIEPGELSSCPSQPPYPRPEPLPEWSLTTRLRPPVSTLRLRRAAAERWWWGLSVEEDEKDGKEDNGAPVDVDADDDEVGERFIGSIQDGCGKLGGYIKHLHVGAASRGWWFLPRLQDAKYNKQFVFKQWVSTIVIIIVIMNGRILYGHPVLVFTIPLTIKTVSLSCFFSVNFFFFSGHVRKHLPLYSRTKHDWALGNKLALHMTTKPSG